METSPLGILLPAHLPLAPGRAGPRESQPGGEELWRSGGDRGTAGLWVPAPPSRDACHPEPLPAHKLCLPG